jgi:pilus assembly protein CpaE
VRSGEAVTEEHSMYPFDVAVVISRPELWEEVQRVFQNLPVRVVFEQMAVDDPVTFLERIERMKPDIVLLDPTHMELSLGELIRQLKATSSAPRVVIVSTRADPESILAAVRAGASEYVYPPLERPLVDALERLSEEIEASKTKGAKASGRTIGVVSVKGGCGATTIACLAAAELAERSKQKALLADFDLVCGSVRLIFNVQVRYSLLDAIHNVQRLDPSYWKALVCNGQPNLEVICAPIDQPLREAPKIHDMRLVVRFIHSLYPWSVFDLGHGLGLSTITLLDEIDKLAVVTTMELQALQRARTTLRHLRELGVLEERIHLILNRVPRRSDITVDDVEEALGQAVFATIPNDFRALENAATDGRLLDRDHPVRAAVGRMVSRIAKLEPSPEPARKRFSLFG